MKTLYFDVMLFLWTLLDWVIGPVRREGIRRAEQTPEFRAWHDENIRTFACLGPHDPGIFPLEAGKEPYDNVSLLTPNRVGAADGSWTISKNGRLSLAVSEESPSETPTGRPADI